MAARGAPLLAAGSRRRRRRRRRRQRRRRGSGKAASIPAIHRRSQHSHGASLPRDRAETWLQRRSSASWRRARRPLHLQPWLHRCQMIMQMLAGVHERWPGGSQAGCRRRGPVRLESELEVCSVWDMCSDMHAGSPRPAVSAFWPPGIKRKKSFPARLRSPRLAFGS